MRQNSRQSKTSLASQKSNSTMTKSSGLASLHVLLLALAVGLVIAEARGLPESEIDRPSQRAIPAFVPRLGKRMTALETNLMDGQRIATLGRIMCENSQDCGQLALLGALVRDIAFEQQANNNNNNGMSEAATEANNDLLRRLVMGQRQDQPLARREIRAALDGAPSSSGSFGGAKRVAFTPRIGRR